MNQHRPALEREAGYFHFYFFRRLAPPIVVERYVAANQLCSADIDDNTSRLLESIVNRHLDVEAIELFLRLFRRNPALTRKIQILFYLVEVRAEYYGYFVNRHPGLARALARSVGALTGAVWKYIKGWYLVSVNEFV